MRNKVTIIVVAIIVFNAGIIFWFSKLTSNKTDTNKSMYQSADQDEASSTLASPANLQFNKNLFSTDQPTSPWVIVNKQHPMQPKDYAPSDLVAVGNGQYLRAEAATALQSVLTAAKQAGLSLTPASGYRSYATQVRVYDNEVAAYGQQKADTQSARPGFSEHQTGLAMDFGSGGCSIDDCFAYTAAGKWLAANAARFGFIMRYTSQNASATGYRAESWHFRYVGRYLAQEMQKQQINSLETFFGVSGGYQYGN